MIIDVTDQAEDDLLQIGHFIAQHNPGAADRMLVELYETIELIASTPLMGRAREDLQVGLRSFSVGNYLIFYTVSPTVLQIVRVVSGYRDLEALF